MPLQYSVTKFARSARSEKGAAKTGGSEEWSISEAIKMA
jgi:hypothetical protein